MGRQSERERVGERESEKEIHTEMERVGEGERENVKEIEIEK